MTLRHPPASPKAALLNESWCGFVAGVHREADVDVNADLIVGSDGFRVLEVLLGTELEIRVETTATRAGCPQSGVVAVLHDCRPHRVRGMAAGAGPS